MGWREKYEEFRNSKDLTKFELELVKEEYRRVLADGETEPYAQMDSAAILAYYRAWHEALNNAPEKTAPNNQ